MKYYSTYKSLTGGYTTVEWTAEEYMNYQMFFMLILAYIFAIFSVVASGFLILLTIFDCDKAGIKPSVWGAIMSGVILIDNHYGFVLTAIQRIFLGDEMYILTHTLNLTYFVVHLFLIFLGPTLYHNVSGESNKKPMLFVYTMVFGFIFFFTTLGSPIHKPKPYKETRTETVN
jgi:hypothetical protein